MSFRALRLEIADAVATVTLDRPDHRNAVDDDMRRDFAALTPELEDPAVRVVVITGAGKAFSAGGSIDHFEKEWNPAEFRLHSRRLSAFYDDLEALEKPVLAAMNGAATGAGLQLALACDLRIAAEDARMGYLEHKLGLIPSHGGATRLVKLLGLSRAKALYFAGDLVDAEEALRIGLIHAVVPAEHLMEETRRRALDLASRAPASLGMAKRLLNAAADTDLRTGQALEAFAQSVAVRTQDHREGVRAFREKRPPRFQGD
ncbi:MAG TPA: enoyl-CoA hydratase/isomerase family protein [bacterium]|nr:enoyl-CoA hydratase/isomerase family protein [bacterium]